MAIDSVEPGVGVDARVWEKRNERDLAVPF